MTRLTWEFKVYFRCNFKWFSWGFGIGIFILALIEESRENPEREISKIWTIEIFIQVFGFYLEILIPRIRDFSFFFIHIRFQAPSAALGRT